jgi:hypothetical protein
MLKLRGIETGPIRHKEYLKELRNSMISVSPFGYGEICYRDFETILAGTLLLKPSMEHLQTYPDFYVKDETYVSFKWDFSDFDEKINSLMGNPDTINKICLQAQERYKYFISSEGLNEFCRRFKNMLGAKDHKCLDKGVAVHTVQSKD